MIKAIFPPLCLRQNNEDLLSALPQIPVKVLFLPFAEAVLLPQTHISEFPQNFRSTVVLLLQNFIACCVLFQRILKPSSSCRVLIPTLDFRKKASLSSCFFRLSSFSPSAFSQNKHPAIPPEKYQKTCFWTDRFQKLPLIW